MRVNDECCVLVLYSMRHRTCLGAGLEQARINFATAPVLHGHGTACEALQSLLVPLEHFHTSAAAQGLFRVSGGASEDVQTLDSDCFLCGRLLPRLDDVAHYQYCSISSTATQTCRPTRCAFLRDYRLVQIVNHVRVIIQSFEWGHYLGMYVKTDQRNEIHEYTTRKPRYVEH